MATYKSFKRAKNPDTPEFTSKYYITNSVLLPEVLESKKVGKMSDKLAVMLMTLTRKYANRPCFAGYSYREDMISEALTNLCQNALKFNPEKSSNPFAYYTTCINSSFLQYLNFEKKHRKIRDELLIEVGENPSFGFQEEYKQQQSEGSEYKSELSEMKDNIAEAKERLKQDAIYAAKKAAEKEAERLAALGVDAEQVYEQAASSLYKTDTYIMSDEFTPDLIEKNLESRTEEGVSLLEYETVPMHDQSDDD